MKNLSLILIALFSFSAVADVERPTEEEKVQACQSILKIVPHELPKRYSVERCLEEFFDFSVIERDEATTTIEMLGQTVEDMTTVCTTVIKNDPKLESIVPQTECNLE